MSPFNIVGIEYTLGEKKISINDLEKGKLIIDRTGIPYVYESNLAADDLATISAQKILEKFNVKHNIDCLISVTQSQKYILPASGSLIHKNLKLPNTCAIFDINAGCSGFVQALILASSLINTYKNILIVCSDTYRKKLDIKDRSTNSVFSDGSAAILVNNESKLKIIKLVNQTFSDGFDYLIQESSDIKNNLSKTLSMSGKELWNFTRLNVVPDIINSINFFKKEKKDIKDLFIHQASKVVVDGIKKEMPNDIHLHENYELHGNTVSSTIPILLKDAKFKFDRNFILSGFGVGIFSYTIGIEVLHN